jgi:hypothetical protein
MIGARPSTKEAREHLLTLVRESGMANAAESLKPMTPEELELEQSDEQTLIFVTYYENPFLKRALQYRPFQSPPQPGPKP